MISKLASSIKPSSTLVITAKANELKAKGIDVVGFGAGEPDFDTPDYIKEAAMQAIMQGFTKYTPAAGTISLRKAIANKLKVENGVSYTAEQIVVNNGAKHSLSNAFKAILNPGDEVIIPAPFWLSYPEMVKIAYGVPKILYTTRVNDYKVTPEQLKSKITKNTKAIILNSPSNPTGVVYTKDEIKAIASVAVEHNLWIISDEIYEYLVYGEHSHTCTASLSEEIYNRTITINGLSKSHAMTGWRIGYVAAPLEVASAIASIQSHETSNPNSIAQKAAEAAMDLEQDFAREMVKVFEERSQLMYEGLSAINGFDVIKPQGAFYCFIDILGVLNKSYKGEVIGTTERFAAYLLEDENVAVVPCSDFGAPSCIRLSYAISNETIEEGIERIKTFIDKLQ